MGLAARPGRGVPAVHHAHETPAPADHRIPGWRTGPERWGRQSRPFTSFRRPRRTRLRVVRPGSSRTATSRPWPMASGRRSGTGRPRRRTSRARSSRRRSPTSSATRSRRRTRGRTCSSGGGASWTIGEACLAGERPRVPGAHRADRTTPCRAGVGHAPHRVDRARGTPDPAGLGRIGSGRQPAGAWVSSTSHATTAPGRPRAVGVQSSSTVIATLSTATASSSPARPPAPCSRRARLRGWLARTVVPSAPGAGKEPRSERRLRRRGGRRPRPDLGLRSGLHPEAVKGDGHGMGGEPLPLRRRTRPA